MQKCLKLAVIILILALCVGCDMLRIEKNWNYGVRIENEFSEEIPSNVADRFKDIMTELTENGVPDSDNRIVSRCLYFQTDDNAGFYLKSYGHVMAEDESYFEIYYTDGKETRLIAAYDREEIAMTACNGEQLYYSRDGILRRISANGEEQVVFDGRLTPPADADVQELLSWDTRSSTISCSGNNINISALYVYQADGAAVQSEQKYRINAVTLEVTSAVIYKDTYFTDI